MPYMFRLCENVPSMLKNLRTRGYWPSNL